MLMYTEHLRRNSKVLGKAYRTTIDVAGEEAHDNIKVESKKGDVL